MIKRNKNANAMAALLASAVVLTACGGDSGSASGDAGNGFTGSGVAAESSDFVFPQFVETGTAQSVSIPSGPVPEFSARRKVSSGTGSAIGFGDPVVLKYSMYAWSTGELVESSDDFNEPVTVRAGVAEGAPEYLSKSLLGRNVGDKMQIVFEQGMADLPSYLSSGDAYVLHVELM